MKLHTESFTAPQDDCTQMSDAYKCKNEVVSVLDLLLQAFSNIMYLEPDSQLSSINYLWLMYKYLYHLTSATRRMPYCISLSTDSWQT